MLIVERAICHACNYTGCMVAIYTGVYNNIITIMKHYNVHNLGALQMNAIDYISELRFSYLISNYFLKL